MDGQTKPISLHFRWSSKLLSMIVAVLFAVTVKPVLSGHSKRPKNGFQYRLSLNADQKYCRMLQGEHSAILSTFIK